MTELRKPPLLQITIALLFLVFTTAGLYLHFLNTNRATIDEDKSPIAASSTTEQSDNSNQPEIDVLREEIRLAQVEISRLRSEIALANERAYPVMELMRQEAMRDLAQDRDDWLRDETLTSQTREIMEAGQSERIRNLSNYYFDELGLSPQTRDLIVNAINNSQVNYSDLRQQLNRKEISREEFQEAMAQLDLQSWSDNLTPDQLEAYSELRTQKEESNSLVSAMERVAIFAGPTSDQSRDVLIDGYAELISVSRDIQVLTPAQQLEWSFARLSELEQWYNEQLPEEDQLSATVFIESQRIIAERQYNYATN